MDLAVINALQKVNKQVEGILSSIRYQRAKSKEASDQLKSCETREVA